MLRVLRNLSSLLAALMTERKLSRLLIWLSGRTKLMERRLRNLMGIVSSVLKLLYDVKNTHGEEYSRLEARMNLRSVGSSENTAMRDRARPLISIRMVRHVCVRGGFDFGLFLADGKAEALWLSAWYS